MSSAGTILGHVWNITRTDGTSTDIPAMQEGFLLTLLNQACLKWHRAHRKNGGIAPRILLSETGFDLVAETAIDDTAGTITATTSITADSNSFPDAAGMAVVWDDGMPDLFSYTSLTSTTFIGVSGLAFAHEDNDQIQPLYKLPDNFRNFSPSDDYGDGVRINGQPLNFSDAIPSAGHFSAREDGTNTFLWLPRGVTGSASVLYEKTSTTIDSTDDIVDVPEENEFFLVWEIIKTVTIPKNGGQPSELYMTAQAEASRELQDALNDRNVGRHVRVRQFGMNTLPRDPALYQRVPR